MRSRDNKSGFILCKREVLARMLEHRFRYRFFQSVLGAAVKTRGFTIGEIDTAFAPRAGGQSFLRRFPVRAILWTIWEIVKFRVETLIERPKSETASRGGSIEANLTARA
jgi:phenylacetate-CoA ligase